MKPVVVSGELALSAEVMYSRVAGKPTLTAALASSDAPFSCTNEGTAFNSLRDISLVQGSACGYAHNFENEILVSLNARLN